jgi:hypothetical protein
VAIGFKYLAFAQFINYIEVILKIIIQNDIVEKYIKKCRGSGQLEIEIEC